MNLCLNNLSLLYHALHCSLLATWIARHAFARTFGVLARLLWDGQTIFQLDVCVATAHTYTRPGAVPSNQTPLRLPSMVPTVFLEPLVFNLRCFALPLHMRRARCLFILLSLGKSCLQLFFFLSDLLALGTIHSPVFPILLVYVMLHAQLVDL